MLVFTPLNSSQSEPCLLYSDYEKLEELNGSMQISFTVPKAAENSAAFFCLDYETAVEDTDGNVYIVKQISSTHTQKTVTAIHKYFNLEDHYFHGVVGGSHTALSLITALLAGTGYTVTADAAVLNRPITVFNFGDDNVLTLVEKACAAAGVDRFITGATSIHLVSASGYDTDLVFKYGHNIKTLEYEVDASNIKTTIKGKSEKLGNDVIYTSPAAATFGLREAKPVEDNEIETVADMQAALKDELRGQDQPEISISLDVLTLDAQVGDNVLLLHEPLGLDIYTRVMAKTTLRNYSASSITIGNTSNATLGDLIADHVEQAKDQVREVEKLTRSRIDQTNDRITLEVEQVGKSIATLEIKANSISSKVTDVENNLSSRITQTATAIRSEVVDVEKGLKSLLTQTAGSIRSEITDTKNNLSSTITQTAAALRAQLTSSVTTITGTTDSLAGKITTNTQSISNLQSTASQLSSTISSQTTTISNLGTRISTAESKITQQANEISARVKTTDYNGNTIVGLLTLTSTTAKIQARNIELVGAVSVLSDITGNLGTITAGNINIYDDVRIGDRLYLNGSSYGSGIYFDRFGGKGKMYSNGNNLVISSDAMEMSSFYGIRVYGGMSIDGDDVVTSRTSGLTFGYSSGSKRLYVTLNGSDVGYIALD